MKLIITNEPLSDPGIIVVDDFTMAHIVIFLRGEGFNIPESNLTTRGSDKANALGDRDAESQESN